jgi:hypothetical protein
MPSNPHVAKLTKKSNNLHVNWATTRSQGLELAVTLWEATAAIEISTICLQST